MRILNISFKNINSLEGEGQVSFDQGPIADSGIFAITGPNGSGKSSILDVITLGLYGETFRFDKPAEHIITKLATESLAQIEFAFNGEKYRSSWHVTRNDIHQPQMTLLQLGAEEKLLAETPSQVRQYLIELTGMDFHKFSKSIVLPQGDFAAFLNALDSERMDILEKISGTDFYADYAQQIKDKHQSLLDKISLVKQDCEILPLIDDLTLEAAEQDLQDFVELSTELKAEKTEVEQQLRKFQQIQVLQKDYQQLLKTQQDLQSKVAQHEQDLQRIDNAPDSQIFTDELNLLDTLRSELTQNQQRLSSYNAELTLLQQQLNQEATGQPQTDLSNIDWVAQKQLIDGFKLKISEIKLQLPREKELSTAITQQIQDKQLNLTEVNNWLQTHQTDTQLLTDFPEIVGLRNIRSTLAELGVQQKSQNKWSKNQTTAATKNKTALTNAQLRIEELKTQIEANEAKLKEISNGKSVAELNELHAEQQLRVNEFKELLAIATVTARFSAKKSFFSWFKRQSNQSLPDVEALQKQVESFKQEFIQEDNIARALDQAIANENLLKRLNSPRDKLVEGKPCFLCGSTHHPYSIKPPVLTDSKKALTDQRSKLQVLKARIEIAEDQLSSALKKQSNSTAKQKFLAEKQTAWLVLANKLSRHRDGFSIEHLVEHKQFLADEQQELDNINNVLKLYVQLERDTANAQAEITAKQALIANLRVTAEQLDANLSERSPEAQEVFAQYTTALNEEAALSKRVELQLKQLGEKMPGKNKENELFDRLNSRRQDYQINALRQTGLQEEIGDLQEKLHQCQTVIQDLQQQLSDNLESLRTNEWLSLNLAVLDKQKLVNSTEQQVKEQRIVFESLQRSFSEKITAQGFKDINELLQTMDLVEKQPEIQARYFDYKKQLDPLQLQVLQLEFKLQAEQQNFDDSLSEQDLREMFSLLSEKAEIAEQEVSSLQNKLEKQQKYRQRYQALENQLAEYQQQLTLAEADLNELTDTTGGLQNKIRQLLISKLLSQANATLEKISGRYYLRSAESEHGLALEIEDTKQKNVRRLPKTLSGGESFVVSLALALALADIANNGKSIESLFLDEGFGNLDSEALYLAMSTLENLKFQGRTVGIISHVDGVKKRIKTQIELVKKPNGYSELKLVA
ncbi:AAA family ATPase [Methylomonas sp. AM2-LC]|uniref:AAA family ATPase n=1 Tax=Methylomonas sp. AM2-LC TaxID=3153301 RepID=UPI0032654D70